MLQRWALFYRAAQEPGKGERPLALRDGIRLGSMNCRITVCFYRVRGRCYDYGVKRARGVCVKPQSTALRSIKAG
jgi:hypothetical protein